MPDGKDTVHKAIITVDGKLRLIIKKSSGNIEFIQMGNPHSIDRNFIFKRTLQKRK